MSISTTIKSIAISAGLLAISACALAVSPASILVRPTADVAGPDVTIKDISTIKCSNKELTGKLQAVAICATPLAGRTQTISRSQVISALGRYGLKDSADVLSPEQISVTRPSVVFTGQAMFDTVRETILADKTRWNESTEVEVFRVPMDQVVPTGSTLHISDQVLQAVRKGRNTVTVELIANGKVYATSAVQLTVRVFGHVLVATKRIAKDEEITADNAAVKDFEITQLPDGLVQEEPEAGMIAGVAITEGSMIRSNWITTPPVIKSGDSVNVSAVGDFVRVTEKGTAVADARVGEQTRIKLDDSRMVTGVVTGPGLVEIQVGTGRQQ